MGMHADAVMLSNLTNRPLADCKTLVADKGGEISRAMAERPEEDRGQMLVRVCCGIAEAAVAKAKAVRANTPPVFEPQIQSPTPEKGVLDAPTVEKGLVEKHAPKPLEASATPPSVPKPLTKPGSSSKLPKKS